MNICKELIDVIKSSNNKDTKGYDTQAKVTRVEGSTVWVHIPGGVDETPVKKTVNAKAGDVVQVRVDNGTAYLIGNASSPPTDDTTALLATEYAKTANAAAESAVQSAKTAGEAAAEAVEVANSVSGIAEEARDSANIAKASAENASEYAARALGNLSTVQSVTETINWITQHGTMTPTSDTELDPSHVYFIQDNDGVYVVGGVHYSVVAEPKPDDLSSYYELGIDESLNNYVATHLALTGDGLYVMVDDSEWKVLVSDDGVYIIDPNNKSVAKYQQSITLGKDDGSQSAQILDYHSIRLFDKENMRIYSRGGTNAQPYFWVSDLRDENGRCSISMYKSFDSNTIAVGDEKYIFLDYYAVNTSYDVELLLVDPDYNPAVPPDPHADDPVDISGWFNVNKTVGMVNLVANSNYQQTEGKLVWCVIRYVSSDANLKVYTLGTRVRTPIDTYYDIKPGGHSFTAGLDLTADGDCSQAFGRGSVAKGHYSHAEGSSTKAKDYAAHSEGSDTEANGNISHSEGYNTKANGDSSHAEGQKSIAAGDVSHAEGHTTKTEGKYSHSEGLNTIAKGNGSHAEGSYTEAGGYASHTEGYKTKTNANYTHAQNRETVAGYSSQTAIGKFNKNQAETAFEIGNGTADDARSNAFAVDWDGNVMAKGMAGMIQMYAGTTAPKGWLLCNGTNVSRTTYAELFDVIGTTYGAGDGSTTFTIPDLRDRFPVGAGTTYALNDKGGANSVTLTKEQSGLPAHGHGFTQPKIPNHQHSMNNIWSNGSGSSSAYTMQSNRTLQTRKTASDGGGGACTGGAVTNHSGANASQAHENRPPYIGINFIICTGKTAF